MPRSRTRTPELSWPDGALGRLAGRFKLEPTTGFRRIAAGRWGFFILGIQVAELNNLGWLARANGSGSISPLAMGRISDPAADGNEMSMDAVNAAGTVLGRLSTYRVSATSWGWKAYCSAAGALQGTAMLVLDGTNAAINGGLTVANGLTVTAGNFLHGAGNFGTSAATFNFLDNVFSAAKGIKTGSVVASNSYTDSAPTNGVFSKGDIQVGGNAAILGAPVSGTPAQHGLYRNNVPKAWGVISGAGGLLAGFNVSSVVRNTGGDYTITLLRAMSSANYCVVATSPPDRSFAYGGAISATQIHLWSVTYTGVFVDSNISFVVFGDE